jgi:hypothetical protein
MRWLQSWVFGAGTLLAACGGAAGSDHLDPTPSGPVPADLCAVQHDQDGIAVCDQLYAEAPFVHLPAASATRVIAGLQNAGFVTADGASYAYSGNLIGPDPEAKRHAVALYELELSGGSVTSFRPVLLFSEALFVKPFMGHAFEGSISQRDGQQYAFDATLPVRVEILDELIDPPSSGATYQARVRLANLDSGVTAADGSCMPALTSYGAEAPFAAGATVTLGVSRAPWMHGLGDDELVFELFVDGVSAGSMMAAAWYRGPIDLVRGTLAPAGTYDGVGHGSPGSIPSLTLEPVEAGGQVCGG